jgi:hypothetical protein
VDVGKALLSSLVVFLILFDTASTLYLLAHGGTEINPTMAWTLRHLGKIGFTLFKLSTVFLAIWVIGRRKIYGYIVMVPYLLLMLWHLFFVLLRT